MPRVSLILPNYNYARYLDERISSLLNQTCREFELLILDDASRDGSCEVIAKYTHDPRVRTCLHTQNSGQVYLRWNEGAAETTGEFLLFAGADDTCHPTMVEKLVTRMEEHPSVGMAFCHSWVITTTGKVLYSTKQWAIDHHAEYWLTDHVVPGRDECRQMLCGNEVVPNASAVLIRRAAFDQAGGFDLTLPWAADYLLWVRIMLHWDVAFLAEPLNFWRYHEETVTAKVMKCQRDAADIEEMYRIAHYLVNALGGEEDREVAAEYWAGQWIERLVGARLRIPMWRNRRIYRIASELDPRLRRRLLRLGSARLLRALGLMGSSLLSAQHAPEA